MSARSILFPSSLRGRLAILVVVALFPLTVLFLVRNLNERQHLSDEARAAALAAAESIASEEARLVSEATSLLTALSASPDVRALGGAACSDVFEVLLDQTAGYANLGIVDASGQLRCSGLPFTPPVDLADRSWFRDAMATGRPAVGRFQIGRVTGRASINVGVPVLNADDAIMGIAFAAIDLEQLSEASLSDLDLLPGTVVTVFDPDRTVLLRSGDDLLAVGQPMPRNAIVDDIVRLGRGTFEGVGLDGMDRLHGFTQILNGPTGDLSGYALVTIPAATAYAAADQVLWVGLFTLFVLGLLGIGGAYLAADRLITRPLGVVTETARRISAGDLSARTGVAASSGARTDELSRLSATLDEMAAALESRDLALRDAELRYRTLIDRLPAMVYIDEPDTTARGVFVSPSVEAITGYSPDEWLADKESWRRSVHPEDLEGALEDLVRGLASHEPFTSEYRFITKDGKVIWVSDEAVVVRDDAGVAQYVLGVFTDVTERRQLEQRLQDAQRMEGIGRLAGGVAHDFNNLLTAIIGYADLALGDADDPQAVRSQVGEIASAAERARHLTAQLLAFARRQVMRPRLVNVDDVLTELLPMLDRLIGEDVRIETRLRAGGSRVRVDPAQLGQVIVNLVTNARDAMPEGGLVEVVTDVETVPEGSNAPGGGAGFGAAGDPPNPGRYVVVDVRDSGSGMDEPTQERLFEPFFTTKEPGRGTGLGLSTSFGIVKQSGGFLDVRSRPGLGTTFRVRLPVASDAEITEDDAESDRDGTGAAPRDAAVDDAILVEAGAPGELEGDRSVLIVEDEASLRALAERVVRGVASHVATASSAEEAMDVTADRTFDLLVTDVILPGMSGPQLADRLMSEGRIRRVLYTTGYPRDHLGTRGLIDPALDLLEKPYLPATLTEHVVRLLRPSHGPDGAPAEG